MIPNLKAKLDALGAQRPSAARPQSPAGEEKTACRIIRHVYDGTDGESASLHHALQLPMEEVSVLCRTPLPQGASMEDVLFLDTETTGLAGTGVVAFLVGLGYYQGGHFVMEQFFLEDYDAEEDLLRCVRQRLDAHRILASFNGKTFDMPLLLGRAIMHRQRWDAEDTPHLDILHASRRLLRRRLERCNFGSMEAELLDFVREGDIPGSQIPEMYHTYLKEHTWSLMEPVLHHNLLDVVHMPAMLDALCTMLRDPEALDYREDTLSCGILYERHGDIPRAMACYRAIAGEDTEAITRLSVLYKREGNYPAALELWRQMARRGVGGSFAYVEAAKAYEHVYRDLDKALHATQVCLRRMRESGLRQGDVFQELEHRQNRLQRKLREGKG